MSSTLDPGSGEERSLGELFSELAQELQTLVRKELELAKTELQGQVSRAAKGAALLGGGAVVGFLAVVLVSFAAAWGAAEVMPAGLAFLAVGVLYLVAAAILVTQGRKRMAGLKPLPTETIATLQEDVQTAKSALSRGMIEDPPWDYPGRRR